MKYIKWILVAVLGIIVISIGWYFNLRGSFDDLLAPDLQTDVPRADLGGIDFTIDVGDSLVSVAKDLEEDGVIKSAGSLRWLDRFEEAGTIKAGDYSFPYVFTLRNLYQAITQGESLAIDKQVTVIEGFSINDIGATLEKGGLATEQVFVAAASNGVQRFSNQYEVLQSIPRGQSLEGYLFPDTYRFFKDSTADEIIIKLLENLDKKITPQMRQDIADSDRTIHEVMTLASIVEKEVRDPEDMKIVARIFLRRLNIGMALQADSTVNYLTESGRARSTLKDLEIDSPYNTYKYPGLPPGPISNPGLNAITAAVYPAASPYFFFLTDPEGQVYYAEDHTGHQRNRELYLN